MSTKRARRLAEYLESELGWQVFTGERRCPRCADLYGFSYEATQKTGDFCEDCGTKLDPEDREPTLRGIEEAIKYALKTKEPTR